MPDIDGFVVLRYLKSNARTQSIPVIFISGINDRETIVRGFQEGAQDYITKPFEPAELKARVKTQIRIKKQNEKLNDLNKHLESEVAKRTKALKISNEKLKSANLRLNEFSLMKSRFLNVISHELRTPLAIISQYLEVIEDELHSEKNHEYFEDMKRACQRLTSFSEKALLVTQLTAEAYLIKKQTVCVHRVIRDEIEDIRSMWEPKEITFQYPHESKLFVEGDVDLITFMIRSLIKNAVRYSPRGAKVYFDCQKEKNGYRLDIIDEGPGFSEEALHFAFEAFGLGEDPVKMKLGLSLAMCHLIMKAHHGKIEISNVDKGARVRLRFEDRKEK